MIKFSQEKVLLLHQLITEETGGDPNVRDIALLDSALESAFATFGGQIIAVAVIIGLIIWGIVALAKRGKSETFVSFDPQSNADHNNLNIVPETSYLETYISSALGVN